MNKFTNVFTVKMVYKAMVSRVATISSTLRRKRFLKSIGINLKVLSYKQLHYIARVVIRLSKAGIGIEDVAENARRCCRILNGCKQSNLIILGDGFETILKNSKGSCNE